MTHLTKTTRHGLFETTVASRPNRETGADKSYGMPMMLAPPEKPFSVGVDMTLDQCTELRRASYDYDWPSVQNLSPRTRGKHY